jgi:hypothetical protein
VTFLTFTLLTLAAATWPLVGLTGCDSRRSGGVKGGISHGPSDEWGCTALDRNNPTQVYDVHATILHPLGIDHTKLTVRHDGIDRRLTDVHGRPRTGPRRPLRPTRGRTSSIIGHVAAPVPRPNGTARCSSGRKGATRPIDRRAGIEPPTI